MQYEIPEDALQEFEDDLLDGLPEDEEDQMGVWLKEYQDCPCCKGWIYSCSGEACKYMNMCYCKIKFDIDPNGDIQA